MALRCYCSSRSGSCPRPVRHAQPGNPSPITPGGAQAWVCAPCSTLSGMLMTLFLSHVFPRHALLLFATVIMELCAPSKHSSTPLRFLPPPEEWTSPPFPHTVVPSGRAAGAWCAEPALLSRQTCAADRTWGSGSGPLSRVTPRSQSRCWVNPSNPASPSSTDVPPSEHAGHTARARLSRLLCAPSGRGDARSSRPPF